MSSSPHTGGRERLRHVEVTALLRTRHTRGTVRRHLVNVIRKVRATCPIEASYFRLRIGIEPVGDSGLWAACASCEVPELNDACRWLQEVLVEFGRRHPSWDSMLEVVHHRERKPRGAFRANIQMEPTLRDRHQPGVTDKLLFVSVVPGSEEEQWLRGAGT